MKTTFKLLTIITSLLLIFACSNKPSGSEYLGKWTDGYTVINITRQSESFIVQQIKNMTMSNDFIEGIYTITKENNLITTGLLGVTISYDKKANTLLVSSTGGGIDRWTRLQDEGEGNQKKMN